ncbi:MAG: hypothetical protein J5I98_09930 [Phaeodactylibacter sp.]|nr:hypothetical protein [Phaeodactylibacter sp.]
MKLYITLIFLLIFHFCSAQKEFSGGYDALRIESEIKLSVPVELYDPVWKYLSLKYRSDNLDVLKALGHSFDCEIAIDSFVDQYFDDKRFNLLNQKNGVRYRSRYVLTGPDNEKDGRELIQIKINDVGNGKLSRGEFKYEIEHYKKAKMELLQKKVHSIIG